MSDLILAASPATAEAVSRLEAAAERFPQVSVETRHTFHAGVYARTVVIPAGVVITGALIKIPTLLTVCGDVMLHSEGGAIRLIGHHLIRGEAGRKQAFVAVSDTVLTMMFATGATTIEEAEGEFTDETAKLLSRRIEPILEGSECLG